ncbi:MAG: carboxymuconolactone decarboxylase family protein [Sphaerochaetaceae bacterium]|nr:carboxymuconolactone decarboxylase family protein [uncultured Sphaerochaeta sp.]MDC7228758.1 carboxymuconolactone decarboxylase family protein [Sphaerochaetaceae bacterium]
MNRCEVSKKTISELFGDVHPFFLPEAPEFQKIRDAFMYGEAYPQGCLSTTEKILIILVSLTATGMFDEIPSYVSSALKNRTTPHEIQEAMYQCAPYIGFPQTEKALRVVLQTFQKASIPLPLESNARVDEKTRFPEGLKIQKAIFGEVIDRMRAGAPEELRHIQDYLSAFCFGDIYTRGSLGVKTRELLTFAILISLGGCESQVKSHIYGNTQVGNGRDELIAAITQCLPYIGFPRALNVLATLTEVLGNVQQQ